MAIDVKLRCDGSVRTSAATKSDVRIQFENIGRRIVSNVPQKVAI